MQTFCSRQKKEAQQLQMAKFNLPNALEKTLILMPFNKQVMILYK